jgi:hypothetical protein
MTYLTLYLAFAIGGFYALWILFLAVMNLARAKQDGTLSRTALILGTPILLVGFALDCFINVFVMTVVLLELPQELTVSERLKRHNRGDGWRKAIAQWAEPLLDPFDPKGDHI